MNRKIKKSRAIEYVILCYAAVLLLLIGPLGILDGTRPAAGMQDSGGETPAGQTQTVGSDDRIQQVFIADGGYLEAISIYAENDLSRKVVSLSISDELGETVFSRRVALESYEAPGFFTVPVEFQTVEGRAYVWQISHPEEDVVLGWQNTAAAGLDTLVYGNYYYVGADQEIQEQVGKNILMRFTYSDPLPAGRKALLAAGIILAAAFLILLAENGGRKKEKEKSLRIQWIFRMTANPLIAAAAAAGLVAVYPLDYYGGVKADKMVYTAGILVMAALLFYVVNARRDSIAPLTGPPLELLREKGMDWLQTLFWAGALWGCIDYVNAMYNIYQDYAYRKVLIFLGLALLSMCAKKRLFSLVSLVWTLVSSVAAWLWYQPYREVEEIGKKMQLDAILFVVAGLVLIQLAWFLWKKKADLGSLSIPYACLVLGFFALLVIFRNTRGWPIYLAAAFLLLYLFFLGWERREKFLQIFCNGIILNFICALVFAMARRPYRAWGFYRYNFVFHTVTVTAAYLTLVLCALLVRLLVRYHKSRKLYTYWGTALLSGMAASLLVMTLSRTGYLAAIVMGVVLLLFLSFACYRERVGYFFRKTGLLVLLVIACFPVTYSAVRLLPPLYDDPYIFELEANEEEWAVHKGDRADSENYITFPRFAYCLDTKLFGEEYSILRKFVDTFMAAASGTDGAETAPDSLAVWAGTGEEMLLASAAGTGELPASGTQSGPQDTEEDYSNGRFEIFKRYIAQWNLTGHDEMGVELADGSLSVHAHNTYLQVIHDHGLVTGLAYLLLGLVSLIRMFQYAYVKIRKGEDDYAALPLAIFLAFAVAGLVEWLFHPCNPLGFSTMAVLTPLLTFRQHNGKVKENEG